MHVRSRAENAKANCTGSYNTHAVYEFIPQPGGQAPTRTLSYVYFVCIGYACSLLKVEHARVVNCTRVDDEYGDRDVLALAARAADDDDDAPNKQSAFSRNRRTPWCLHLAMKWMEMQASIKQVSTLQLYAIDKIDQIYRGCITINPDSQRVI